MVTKPSLMVFITLLAFLMFTVPTLATMEYNEAPYPQGTGKPG